MQSEDERNYLLLAGGGGGGVNYYGNDVVKDARREQNGVVPIKLFIVNPGRFCVPCTYYVILPILQRYEQYEKVNTKILVTLDDCDCSRGEE